MVSRNYTCALALAAFIGSSVHSSNNHDAPDNPEVPLTGQGTAVLKSYSVRQDPFEYKRIRLLYAADPKVNGPTPGRLASPSQALDSKFVSEVRTALENRHAFLRESSIIDGTTQGYSNTVFQAYSRPLTDVELTHIRSGGDVEVTPLRRGSVYGKWDAIVIADTNFEPTQFKAPNNNVYFAKKVGDRIEFTQVRDRQ